MRVSPSQEKREGGGGRTNIGNPGLRIRRDCLARSSSNQFACLVDSQVPKVGDRILLLVEQAKRGHFPEAPRNGEVCQ